MPISTEILIALPLIVLFAYIIFGISGFGSGILCIPLLAHFFPLQFVVPMVGLLDVSAAIWTGARSYKKVSVSEIKWLVPFMLTGILLGVWLLIYLPQKYLLSSLGVFVLCYGLYNFFNHQVLRTVRQGWAAVAGLTGGLFGAAFGTGGPIYMIYLSARLHDKSELRATISTIISISTVARLLLFLISGLLLQPNLLLTALCLFPLMPLGLFIGNKLHHVMPRNRIVQLVSVLLIINGVSLLARAI